jgi:hypothetical protein
MRSKLLVMAMALGAATWLLWPDSAHHEKDVFFDRVWLDRLPQTPTEKFDVFLVLQDPGAGVFQNTSFYEGDYSVFGWEDHRPGRMKIIMLQNQQRHELGYEITDKGCGGFDYCMRLRGAPRGAERYYSMRDWVIESRDGSARLDPAALERLIAQTRDRK